MSSLNTTQYHTLHFGLVEKSFWCFQLEVKDHIREAQKKKAYDPKKSCWVPNTNKEVGGYFEGLSEEEIKYDTFSAGKKLAVNVNGEVISLGKIQIM